MKILIKWLLLLLVINHTYAQECEMTPSRSQIEYMNQSRTVRNSIDLSRFNNTTTIIPIVAHIIRASDGTGGLILSDLDIAMQQLNTLYQQVNFEFTLCDVRYIDNDDYFNEINYSTSDTSEEYIMAVPNLAPSSVNVFFAPNTIYNSVGVAGWSSFPADLAAYDRDWTVINNDYATESTFAHEIGHYFSLYHTHECLNNVCELVDGSNCGPGVGDELCDTSADPNLSGCVNIGCFYICNDLDATGDSYEPDTDNIMSYSLKECRTTFSPEQIARIQQSYAVDRSYLSTNCCAVDIVHTGIVPGDFYRASNSVVSTGTIADNQSVTYTAENFIYLNPGFVADAANSSVFEASIFWCSGIGPIGGKTDQQITEEGVTLKNYPNPFTGQTTIEFTLPSDSPVNLFVSDVTGKQIAVLLNGESTTEGKHQITFNAQSYPAGMYYYTIQAGSYTGTQKMILAK